MDKKRAFLIKDLMVFGILIIITIWLVGFQHDCSDLYTVKCSCPCAKVFENLSYTLHGVVLVNGTLTNVADLNEDSEEYFDYMVKKYQQPFQILPSSLDENISK